MTRRATVAVAVLAAVAIGPVGGAAAQDAAIGAALFRRAWVPAPSTTRANDGLGPHFDARACAACHPGGNRPALGVSASGAWPRGLVVRLERADGGPDPVYGRQLQTEAVAGVAPEARLRLKADEVDGRRRLLASVSETSDGRLAADTRISLRLAPSLIGAGAIEAVDEAAVRALADPDDRDGDGIAGRVSEVVDAEGRARLGRWGFRASGIDLADQTAAAFSTDMGMSSRRHPDPHGDCTAVQTACRAAPAGSPDQAGDHEIGEEIVGRIALFLAAPAPSGAPGADGSAPNGAHGARVFAALGCPACHAPLEGAGRVVHSDLLLHDLGVGLAAGDPERRAGREWRTAPLLGLGRRLAAGTPLLHDGRARTLEEAVLWHGGEAAGAVARYRAAAEADRRALAAHLATFR